MLSGCSVYESDGRKYLEQTGLTFSHKSGQSAYIACSTEVPEGNWVAFEKTENAQLSTNDSENFELLVTPIGLNAINCYFKFSSAREMYENSSSAEDFCLHQSPAECTHEFAFH